MEATLTKIAPTATTYYTTKKKSRHVSLSLPSFYDSIVEKLYNCNIFIYIYIYKNIYINILIYIYIYNMYAEYYNGYVCLFHSCLRIKKKEAWTTRIFTH